MANPFQQQSRLRKVVYFGLILALFTGSLFLRKFVVEPEATALQLREQAQGEVELTSSAVRLTLLGSRGLATCVLWQTALEKQKKHQWNEMELLVSSITKLQPHFITPWLFQSWNLAFNVAVECDRVRDKYFYVSRGLQLLAEGERRNQGSLEDVTDLSGNRIRFPGNPDMRFHMGFTYQLKIGNSDEKYVMRSLLDLSCIDPLKRDPDKLLASDARNYRVVDLAKFEKFCADNPRLVRRLREQVGLGSPKQVVDFLRDNQEVPSRFEPLSGSAEGVEQSELKFPPRLQFPILPPAVPELPRIPDAREREFPDSMDVYRASQAWYYYAMEPLPPEQAEPGMRQPEFDQVRHRIPKMAIHIFRAYPSRAQAYIAETLEEEGWFDEEGWSIKDWFDSAQGRGKQVRVGRESKYHAGPAWQRAYEMYMDYGSKNGLYMPEEKWDELEQRARLYRETFDVKAGQSVTDLPRKDRERQGGKMGESFDAHKKLYWNVHYRTMTNFDTYHVMTDVERRPEAVAAHKDLFYADRLRRQLDPVSARQRYEKGLPQWLELLLAYPGYRSILDVQIETYEAQLKYLRVLRDLHASELQDLTTILSEFGTVRPVLSPVVNFPLGIAPGPEVEVQGRVQQARNIDQDQLNLILPFRNVRGPFESIFVYEVGHQDKLKDVLLAVTQGPLPVPLAFSQWQKDRVLTVRADRDLNPPSWPWQPLLSDQTIQSTRDRLGLNRARPQGTGSAKGTASR